MIRYKIRGITFECDEEKGTAVVTMPEAQQTFTNAIEGWNYFTARALYPFEKFLRFKLQENGFNRWTGAKNPNFTETELKMLDEAAAARERMQ